MKKSLHILASIFFLCLLCCSDVLATHYKAGYITYTRDQGANPNPRKILYELILFTNDDSGVEDSHVTINMGDGKSITVQRQGNEIPIGNNKISKAIYKWEYTYGADGTYTVSWLGINRNNGILNIAQPSQDVSMFISTTINLNSLNGSNSSPNFLAPEPIFAKVGKRLEYNILAYDAEGDSLGYRLITPLTTTKGGRVESVPGYTLPHQTFDCTNEATTGRGSFSLNPIDGQLIWDAPCRAGTYNIAIAIEEWKVTVRDGRRIAVKKGEIIYDMLVTAFDHPADGLTILNKNELSMSAEGYVAVKPGEKLTLKIGYEDLIPSPTPIPENNQQPFQMFASKLSMLLNTNINYTIENTTAGAVGTFTFTPTETLARQRPYFLSVYGKAGDAFAITRSIGIYVGDFVPQLVLLRSHRNSFTEEGHLIVAPNRLSKLTVFVQYATDDYTLELNTNSLLAENAKVFSFTTRDSANSKVGELLFMPHDAQARDVPREITFNLTAQPSSTSSTSDPVVDKLITLVVVKYPTGVKDELKKERITIAPNPATEKLLLKSDDKAILYLYSATGKFVWEHHILPGSNELNRPDRLSPGLYIYTIIDNTGYKKTGKLVLL